MMLFSRIMSQPVLKEQVVLLSFFLSVIIRESKGKKIKITSAPPQVHCMKYSTPASPVEAFAAKTVERDQFRFVKKWPCWS